jgi:tripartite-type tricarboxylate transporter receptor subunit TctC
MDTLSTALSLHKQGLVKILAIASTERDAGAPRFDCDRGRPARHGLQHLLRAGRAQAAASARHGQGRQASQAAIASPDFQSRMKELMIRTSDASPAATLQFMNDEMKTWSEVAKKGNLKID